MFKLTDYTTYCSMAESPCQSINYRVTKGISLAYNKCMRKIKGGNYMADLRKLLHPEEPENKREPKGDLDDFIFAEQENKYVSER